MKKLVTAMLFSFCFVILTGKESDKQGKLFIIPIAGYENETNVMLGGLVYYTYRPLHRPFSLPPDAHYVNGLVSFNKQVQLLYRSKFYVSEERYYISPQIDYELWPTKFFGFGNNTREEDAEKYTNKRISYRLGVNRTIKENFSAGLQIERDNYNIDVTEDDGLLGKKDIAGSERYGLNSIGLSLIYDTRDVALYPEEGSLYELRVKQAFEIAGGNYTFTQYELDLRNYFSINEQNVFAFQFYSSHIDNKAPFQKLNDLGDFMRGYEAKRFIDKSMVMLRGEYRFFPWQRTILSRLGGVVFAETGQVANHLSDIRFSETKLSYGTGLRIALVPSEKINLRVDFGLGKKYLDIVITTYEIF